MLPTSYAEESYQRDRDSDALRQMVYALQGYTDPGAIGEAMSRAPKAGSAIMDYFNKNYAASGDMHSRATGALASLMGANAGAAAQTYGADSASNNVLNQIMGQQNVADIQGRYDIAKAQEMTNQQRLMGMSKLLSDIQTTRMKGQQDIAKELYKPSSANPAMAGAIMQTYQDLVKKLGDPAKAYAALNALVTAPPGIGMGLPQPAYQAPNAGGMMSLMFGANPALRNNPTVPSNAILSMMGGM